MIKPKITIVLLLTLLIALGAMLCSCSEKVANISLSINNNEVKSTEDDSYSFDLEIKKDEQIKLEDLQIKLLNDKSEQIDKSYSITYFKLENNKETLINKTDILTNGEYIVKVNYEKTEYILKINVKVLLNETLKISVDKTSAIYNESTISCAANLEESELYVVDKKVYENLEKSLDKATLLSVSTKYNKDNLQAGEYYIFAVQKQLDLLSNFIEIKMLKNNSLEMEYLDDQGFVIDNNIEYREGIFLFDINIDSQNVQVKDDKGEIIQGSFKWKRANEIIDCGTTGAYVEFIPNDKNYEVIKKFIEFNNVIVKKKIEKPDFNLQEQTYTGENISFEFEDSKLKDLYKIYRDNKLIDTQENVVENLIDAKEYSYEIVLKDPRNYEWIEEASESFNVVFKINPAESFIRPKNLNVAVNDESSAKITISYKEGADILSSIYFRSTLKCVVKENQTTNISIGSIEIERGENPLDEIVFKNVQFTDNSNEGTIIVTISAKGFNFKDITEELTINFSKS